MLSFSITVLTTLFLFANSQQQTEEATEPSCFIIGGWYPERFCEGVDDDEICGRDWDVFETESECCEAHDDGCTILTSDSTYDDYLSNLKESKNKPVLSIPTTRVTPTAAVTTIPKPTIDLEECWIPGGWYPEQHCAFLDTDECGRGWDVFATEDICCNKTHASTDGCSILSTDEGYDDYIKSFKETTDKQNNGTVEEGFECWIPLSWHPEQICEFQKTKEVCDRGWDVFKNESNCCARTHAETAGCSLLSTDEGYDEYVEEFKQQKKTEIEGEEKEDVDSIPDSGYLCMYASSSCDTDDPIKRCFPYTKNNCTSFTVQDRTLYAQIETIVDEDGRTFFQAYTGGECKNKLKNAKYPSKADCHQVAHRGRTVWFLYVPSLDTEKTRPTATSTAVASGTGAAEPEYEFTLVETIENATEGSTILQIKNTGQEILPDGSEVFPQIGDTKGDWPLANHEVDASLGYKVLALADSMEEISLAFDDSLYNIVFIIDIMETSGIPETTVGDNTSPEDDTSEVSSPEETLVEDEDLGIPIFVGDVITENVKTSTDQASPSDVSSINNSDMDSIHLSDKSTSNSSPTEEV
eukprot:Awhi_evm1s8482